MHYSEKSFRQSAEHFAETVKDHFNVDLDFTGKSLKKVDGIIGKYFKKHKDEEHLATSVLSFGSYLGEVIRRNVGGKWVVKDSVFDSSILVKGAKGEKIEFLPFKRVIKRFYSRSNYLYPYYRKVLKTAKKYDAL